MAIGPASAPGYDEVVVACRARLLRVPVNGADGGNAAAQAHGPVSNVAAQRKAQFASDHTCFDATAPRRMVMSPAPGCTGTCTDDSRSADNDELTGYHIARHTAHRPTASLCTATELSQNLRGQTGLGERRARSRGTSESAATLHCTQPAHGEREAPAVATGGGGGQWRRGWAHGHGDCTTTVEHAAVLYQGHWRIEPVTHGASGGPPRA